MERLSYLWHRFFRQRFIKIKYALFSKNNRRQYCCECGNETYFDFVLDDVVWMIMVRDSNKVLCLNCLAKTSIRNNKFLYKDDFVELFINGETCRFDIISLDDKE